MKSFLLACAAIVADFIAVTWLYRTFPGRRPVIIMMWVVLGTVPCFVATYLVTPSSLGVLPPGLTAPSTRADLAFGVFVYLGAVFGGLLQIYNIADRGLSLRLLIDIDESPRKILAAEELWSRYGGGRGFEWMYEKRLDGLRQTGLITVVDDTVRPSGRGRTVARAYERLQTFLRLHAEL